MFQHYEIHYIAFDVPEDIIAKLRRCISITVLIVVYFLIIAVRPDYLLYLFNMFSEGLPAFSQDIVYKFTH